MHLITNSHLKATDYYHSHDGNEEHDKETRLNVIEALEQAFPLSIFNPALFWKG
jgi:hypothetical protein